jgi:hypothetical protein
VAFPVGQQEELSAAARQTQRRTALAVGPAARCRWALFSTPLPVGTEGGEYVADYAVRALYGSSPEAERVDRTIWMQGLVGGIVGREKFNQIERLVMIETSTKIIPRLQIIRDRAVAKGIAKGLEKGMAKGVEQGVEQGLEQGPAKGILEGEARALLKLMLARGLRVTEAQRRQVMGCTDPAQLELWIERAATAGSVSAVLAPRPAAKSGRG